MEFETNEPIGTKETSNPITGDGESPFFSVAAPAKVDETFAGDNRHSDGGRNSRRDHSSQNNSNPTPPAVSLHDPIPETPIDQDATLTAAELAAQIPAVDQYSVEPTPVTNTPPSNPIPVTENNPSLAGRRRTSGPHPATHHIPPKSRRRNPLPRDQGRSPREQSPGNKDGRSSPCGID